MALFNFGLAFALAVMVAAMGYNGVSAFSEQQDIDKAVIAVHELRDNVHKSIQGRGSYAGISTDKADDLGLLPNAFAPGRGPLNTTLSLSNAGGRQLDIVIGELQATDNSRLCTELMSKRRDAWQRRAIDGAVLGDDSIADIQAACEEADQILLRTY